MTKEKERLLKLRRQLKQKRPRFLRSLWWKFPKFKNNPKWRKPKGIDNPMRLRKKGYPPLAEVGYRSPSAVRGLHPSGLVPVRVASIRDLENLEPGKHIAVIASSVGLKKRRELIEKAKELGVRVANA